ncbi:MAG: 30S ribosome-binding factor RbfA [Fibrobacterales bacterium]
MSRRTDKLNNQIQKEIGQILQTEVSDSRIGFATISRVEVTTDLAHAKVFVSVMGNESQRKSAMIGLKQASSHIRTLLSRSLKTRTVPKLNFVLDLNLDHSYRIQELLSGLEELKDPPSTDNTPTEENE